MLTALSLIRGLIFQFKWTRFSLRSTCLSEPCHCYCIFHCSRGSSGVRTREARPVHAGDGSSMLDNVILYCKILKQHVFGDDVTDCRPYVAQRCVGTPSPAKWTGDVPWHGSRICCVLYFSTNVSCILSILTVSVRWWVSVTLDLSRIKGYHWARQGKQRKWEARRQTPKTTNGDKFQEEKINIVMLWNRFPKYCFVRASSVRKFRKFRKFRKLRKLRAMHGRTESLPYCIKHKIPCNCFISLQSYIISLLYYRKRLMNWAFRSNVEGNASTEALPTRLSIGGWG